MYMYMYQYWMGGKLDTPLPPIPLTPHIHSFIHPCPITSSSARVHPSLVPWPRGEKRPGTNLPVHASIVPSKAWGSAYDRITSVIIIASIGGKHFSLGTACIQITKGADTFRSSHYSKFVHAFKIWAVSSSMDANQYTKSEHPFRTWLTMCTGLKYGL